jgi:hypothetical protein
MILEVLYTGTNKETHMKKRNTLKINIGTELKPIRKSRKGYNVYPVNPFLMGIVVDIRDKTATVARGCQVINRDGEWVANATIGQIREVDENEFIKFYTSNLSYFFELSSASLRILPLILKVVQKSAIGKDEILFSFEVARETYLEMTEKKLSKTIYYKAIDDLIRNGFIAISPKSPGAYYLNPNLIFNGDRVSFIKEYQKSPLFKQTKAIINSMISQTTIPDLLEEESN